MSQIITIRTVSLAPTLEVMEIRAGRTGRQLLDTIIRHPINPAWQAPGVAVLRLRDLILDAQALRIVCA